jgi:hypothetical protein
VGSHPNVWLFIHLLFGQEALAMSSEEDEAVCLTNNSLERAIDHCLLTLCVILIYDFLKKEPYFIEF